MRIVYIIDGIEYADADEARDAVTHPDQRVTRVADYGGGDIRIDDIRASEIPQSALADELGAYDAEMDTDW